MKSRNSAGNNVKGAPSLSRFVRQGGVILLTSAKPAESVLPHNLPHRRQQSLHFLKRVVMCQPNPQESAVFLHIQPFCQVQRVVISIPGKESALSQLRRKLQ